MLKQDSFNLECFNRDGIFFPLTLIDGKPADRLIDHYQDFQKKVSKIRGRELYIKPHLVSTWLDGIVFNRQIIDVVEAAIVYDIVLWSSDFFVKTAGKGTWVSWHQDLPYWNLNTSNVVSVWLALTPSIKRSGSMKVILGSHLDGELGTIKDIEGDVLAETGSGNRKSKPGNLLSHEQALDVEINEDDAIDIELRPWQYSIHHGNIIHGGRPILADYDRVGFVMRFISGKTFCKSGIDSAMLIQGNVHHNEFILENRPQTNFGSLEMEHLRQALVYPSGFGDKSLK